MISPLENGRYLWAELRNLSTVESRYLALHALSEDVRAAAEAAARIQSLHRAILIHTHVCTSGCFHPTEVMPRPESPYIVCEHCWEQQLQFPAFRRQPIAAAWPCQTTQALTPHLVEVHLAHLDALKRSDAAAALALVTDACGDVPTATPALASAVLS